MTLIVTLGNNEHAYLLSDRQLTVVTKGKGILRNFSTKAGLITADDARVIYAYTGLAQCGNFETALWILDTLSKAAESSGRIFEVLAKFQDIASSDFNSLPSLKHISRVDKRLQIVFIGYLHTGQLLTGEISNYTNPQLNEFLPEARDGFLLTIMTQQKPSEIPFSYLSWDGCINAAKLKDFLPLKPLVENCKPPQAVIGKAVEIMREIADRPGSQKTIGKEIITARIGRDLDSFPITGFYPDGTAPSLYLLDMQDVRTGTPKVSIRDFQISVEDTLFVDPKTPRNAPCPCRSGEQYKNCHGSKK